MRTGLSFPHPDGIGLLNSETKECSVLHHFLFGCPLLLCLLLTSGCHENCSTPCTDTCAQNLPLLTDPHLQQYFTLGLIRFPPQETLGTPSSALILIKSISLILLIILKNLDNFNRALRKKSHDFSSSNYCIKA